MPDYDFSESFDSPAGRFIASITNTRLDNPNHPPKSTLTITDAQSAILGSWTLGIKEFFTNDPDANAIAPGTWNVDKHCYTHEIWSGNYSPGTPLAEHAPREFCF